MKIFNLNHFDPSPVGHGGNHRTYQIHQELNDAFGKENIVEINYSNWKKNLKKIPARSNSYKQKILQTNAYRQWQMTATNPLRLSWTNKNFNPFRFSNPAFLSAYEQIVQNTHEEAVCLIDDPGFHKIIAINKANNIPTIALMQNFEALDSIPHIHSLSPLAIKSIFLDFSNEIKILASCEKILTISKVEAGFIGGLGLQAINYPYIPLGLIREGLFDIRRKRSEGQIDKNLFLLLGTADHSTTGEGMKWFLDHFLTSSLDENIKIAMVGKGTDKYKSEELTQKGVEFKGFVSQEQLDDLMVRAAAVIIPQFRGFGTLTRLPEFSCAGIPVICSRHPCYALDIPPGVFPLENHWSAWESVLLRRNSDIFEPNRVNEYEKWEAGQVTPLHKILSDVRNVKQNDLL